MPEAATLLGAAMLGALVLYAVFGGADFGAGLWHLLASGPRRHAQRDLIAHAIGPIWEANHVWLILVVVVLFTGFPRAFGEISILLHAPLLALLFAIVLRGSSFAFQSAAGDRHGEKRGWGAVFAIASVAAPVLLGMTLAALASGRLVEAPSVLTWRGPWMSPFAICTGFFTLVLFAFLAAVYLTFEATDELREDFRRRALITGALSGVFALATFVLAAQGAPILRTGLSARSWSVPLHVCTGVAAIVALGALVRRRFRLARAAAAAQVSLVVLGWGASQYPFLIVPTLTLDSASAAGATQRLLLWVLAAGAVVLLPSLWVLFRIFKSAAKP
jgi:cytochrome d ubiquinol oxidase subunit II